MKRLIFPALLLLASPSQALISTYEFSGNVAEAGWKLGLGDTVTGTIEIDDRGAEEFDFRGESARYYYAARITMKAGGVTFSTDPGGINGHDRWEWQVDGTGQRTGNHLLNNAPGFYCSFNLELNMINNDLSLLAANDMDQRWTGGTWAFEIDSEDEDRESFDNPGGEITSLRKVVMADAAPVPEPASAALLGSALAGFFAYRRRKATS